MGYECHFMIIRYSTHLCKSSNFGRNSRNKEGDERSKAIGGFCKEFPWHFPDKDHKAIVKARKAECLIKRDLTTWIFSQSVISENMLIFIDSKCMPRRVPGKQ